MKYYRVVFAAACMCTINIAEAEGIQDLRNACDVVGTANQGAKRLMDATALLVPKVYLNNNGNGTFSINHSSTWPGYCPNSIFYNQDHMDYGRSAVLIGRDKMITAPHAIDTDINQWYVIFRSVNQSTCSNFNFDAVDPANIYEMDQAFAPINTWNYGLPGQYDFAVFRLTRPVVDRRPVKIRRDGAPFPGQTIYQSSYLLRAGLKVDFDGRYYGRPDATSRPPRIGSGGVLDLDFSNIHGIDGSSGGAIYNPADQTLETVFSWSMNATVGYGGFTDPPCIDLLHVPGHGATNGSLSDVEALIPREEFKVSPLDRVVHVVDIGGPLEAYFYDYSIAGYVAPRAKVPGYNQGTVSAPYLTYTSRPGQTPPSIVADLTGSFLVPQTGQSSFGLFPDIANVTTCGVWDYQVDVSDLGNNYTYPIRHRFEIGLQEIAVSPNDKWSIHDIPLPVSASRQYVLTNSRPTAVTISVTKDVRWLRINGGDSTTLTLGPKGSPSDHATVTVSFGSQIARLSQLDAHLGHILVSYLDSTCAAGSGESLAVEFVYGQKTLYMDAAVDLEPASPGNAWGPYQTVALPISYPGYCIENFKVKFGFYDVLPGGSGIQGIQAGISRNGDLKTLWQGGVPPTGYWYSENLPIAGNWLYLPTMHFNDAITPPTSGTLLSVFNGLELNGSWTVSYRADGNYQPYSLVPSMVAADVTASTCH